MGKELLLMENKNKTLLISLFIAICHFSREFADFKDFDRFLGISSISRILKEYLPWNSKIASGVTFSSSPRKWPIGNGAEKPFNWRCCYL